MKALVCQQLGDPLIEGREAPLTLVHAHPCPSEKGLKSRDVRIQVIAAALNFADALQVQVSQVEDSTHEARNVVC